MSKVMDFFMKLANIEDDADMTENNVEATPSAPVREREFLKKPKQTKFAGDDVKRPARTTEAPSYSYQSESRRSKLVDMGSASSPSNMVISQPLEYENCKEITNHLKAKKPVVVNLERLDKVTAKKVVDFLSGAVYALDGKMRKVSNGIIVVVPNNMDIMGSIDEELTSSLFEELNFTI